jgi:hypothetical protein
VTATIQKIKVIVVRIIGEKRKKRMDELWVMGRGSTMN